MKAVHLCAPCRKRWKAILAAYGVGPSAMRDKRSLAREWALIIRESLNGLCWCAGGKCKGDRLPPRIPSVPTPLYDQWRADEKKSARSR